MFNILTCFWLLQVLSWTPRPVATSSTPAQVLAEDNVCETAKEHCVFNALQVHSAARFAVGSNSSAAAGRKRHQGKLQHFLRNRIAKLSTKKAYWTRVIEPARSLIWEPKLAAVKAGPYLHASLPIKECDQPTSWQSSNILASECADIIERLYPNLHCPVYTDTMSRAMDMIRTRGALGDVRGCPVDYEESKNKPKGCGIYVKYEKDGDDEVTRVKLFYNKGKKGIFGECGQKMGPGQICRPVCQLVS